MKWILLIAIIGIAEVATIGQLHAILGTSNLIYLYIGTTAVGALFLFIKASEFNAAIKSAKGLEKKFKKRLNSPGFRPTPEDIEKISPMVFIGLYVPALVLIAVPGIISDLIGMLLVFPGLSPWLVRHQIDRAMASTE